jgi:hypothetical protein
MAAMLFLDGIGPNAEQLALKAGEAAGVAVGYDGELDSATFDSDAHDEEGLRTVVVEALAAIDPEWESQLQLSE